MATDGEARNPIAEGLARFELAELPGKGELPQLARVSLLRGAHQMGILGKVGQLATLKNYPNTLKMAALRSLKGRSAWREELGKQDWMETYKACQFSRQLTISQAAPFWWGAFKDKRNTIREYLDVGSWEGQSAVFAAWLFPEARITAADWFASERATNLFFRNTASFSGRLETIKGTSWDVLSRLQEKDRTFDAILIDADHRFDGVMLDTIKSWPLLRQGGYLIWDDYLWTNSKVPYLSPKQAIDAWIYSRRNVVEPIFADYQVCVRKTASDPELIDMAYFSDPRDR